jgi:hypothetical protein
MLRDVVLGAVVRCFEALFWVGGDDVDGDDMLY